ncbi:MAG TPA: hypothetical protein VFQ88_03015 [Nevskiaceae bacterium]|nr:hypothetical protein [Nevskiaceae bacterium]
MKMTMGEALQAAIREQFSPDLQTDLRPDSRNPAHEPSEQALPDVAELSERLGKPDPVFEAWRGRQNKKSWAHLDLSALRIGYELGLRAVTAECAELRKHNAALAALWSKAVDRTTAAQHELQSRTDAGAECPVQERSAWRDIATAPKDGTAIWAFNGEQARMRWIAGDGYALWIYDDALLGDACPDPDQPTHWMPLPSEPVSAEVAT